MKPEPIIGRRVGNTTRLVDFYIQELFEKGSIVPEDHHLHTRMAINDSLAKRIIFRLQNEHKYMKFKAERNKQNSRLEITLLKPTQS